MSKLGLFGAMQGLGTSAAQFGGFMFEDIKQKKLQEYQDARDERRMRHESSERQLDRDARSEEARLAREADSADAQAARDARREEFNINQERLRDVDEVNRKIAEDELAIEQNKSRYKTVTETVYEDGFPAGEVTRIIDMETQAYVPEAADIADLINDPTPENMQEFNVAFKSENIAEQTLRKYAPELLEGTGSSVPEPEPEPVDDATAAPSSELGLSQPEIGTVPENSVAGNMVDQPNALEGFEVVGRPPNVLGAIGGAIGNALDTTGQAVGGAVFNYVSGQKEQAIDAVINMLDSGRIEYPRINEDRTALEWALQSDRVSPRYKAAIRELLKG